MAAIPVADGRLWYDVRGEGPPLVFVHGGWLDGDAWRAQRERFSDAYRVVTFDLRGHGRTGGTDRRRYSVDLFADDLERLLDHLDLDRPVLCGLSLGSMVVQTFLARRPARAAAAILAGPVRSMPPVAFPQGMKSVASPLPALATSLSLAGTQATFRSMLAAIRATTGGPWLALDPAVRSRAFAAVGEVSRTEYRKVFRALYRYSPPALSAVRTPTLVVYGEREAPALKRQGAHLATTVADGRCVEVADAAHLVNEDNPDAFNDALATFLGEYVATGG